MAFLVSARRAPGPARRPSTDDLLLLRAEPHRFLLDVARRHGGLVRYPVGPWAFHLVTDPDLVWQVLVERQARYTKATFQYRLLASVTGEGLLTMDGPAWLARRRMEQPGFHRAAVGRFAGMMAEAAEDLARDWEGAADRGEAVDVAAAMLHLALRVVARALFSVDVGPRAGALADATLTVLDRVMFRARTLGTVPLWLPTPGNRRFHAALRVLDEAIHGTIATRRAGGGAGDDFLGRLMAQDDPATGVRLSDRQLRDEMVTMLVAGHETVASALAWTWHLLGGDAEADARLAAEAHAVLGDRVATAEDAPRLAWTGMVFDEALRLYPPAWMLSRRALEADELAGCVIPRGGTVILSPYVTHRLDAHWREPERFDPGRFEAARAAGRHRGAYLPFGAGPHLCIGNHFALLEAAIVLATLARRVRLVPAAERPVQVEAGVTLHPRGGLWMRVERR